MKIFSANIANNVAEFFKEFSDFDFETVNSKIKSICGINPFFENQAETDELLTKLKESDNVIEEPDRAEYGDFQTNKDLSEKICKLLQKEINAPEVIIEPTCGKGSFIISGLKIFNSLKKIYGVEIYKPYVWETKFSILDFFLSNEKSIPPPEITIFHANVFDFNFGRIASSHKSDKILIIGNPPWVTNSKLSSLSSNNLPVKSNFKKHNGFDAITGKGNFDIGEYISIKILSSFSDSVGEFAFLIKNSVVKSILLEQKFGNYKISNLKQFNINTKKEFNVSVNASLFTSTIGKKPEKTITEYDFYRGKKVRVYGWVNNKFVADIDLYLKSKNIDGEFPFVWRQGVKHDASKVMELEKYNDEYLNNNNERVIIEEDLLYGLLKSSDLKGQIIEEPRKYIIITQKKIGDNTEYIEKQYPKTYTYLYKNIEIFNGRKSSIYKGKPKFSIFGIGEYSFKPFKVGISGMYKSAQFSLIKPYKGKPVMLDDTCYFVGFDKLVDAEITRLLLNKKITQDFIRSIAFKDAKRMITKDLLMRINLREIAFETEFSELKSAALEINLSDWEKYKRNLFRKGLEDSEQLNIFDEQTANKSGNSINIVAQC